MSAENLKKALERLKAQPFPFYSQLNQQFRSVKDHGQYRRAAAQAHSNSVDGAGNSTGGADAKDTFNNSWVSGTGKSWLNTSPTAGTSAVTATINFHQQAMFADHHAALLQQLESLSQPPKLPYAGVRTGEITGYRWWWVVKNPEKILFTDINPNVDESKLVQYKLCSLAHDRIWQPNETVYGNVDKSVDGHVGSWTVFGGTYAFDTEARALREYDDLVKSHQEHMILRSRHQFLSFPVRSIDKVAFVLGKIKMWGEVIEHAEGYRAEYAKLVALDELHFGDDTMMTELRQYYKV